MSKGTKIAAIVGVVLIIGAGVFYWKANQPVAPAAPRGVTAAP